jgi:hypothetical protein
MAACAMSIAARMAPGQCVQSAHPAQIRPHPNFLSIGPNHDLFFSAESPINSAYLKSTGL